MTKKETIKSQLAQLEKITQWFGARGEIDLEIGLAKAKEGAALVKNLKIRLKKVENEFNEIKKDLQSSEKQEN